MRERVGERFVVSLGFFVLWEGDGECEFEFEEEGEGEEGREERFIFVFGVFGWRGKLG